MVVISELSVTTFPSTILSSVIVSLYIRPTLKTNSAVNKACLRKDSSKQIFLNNFKNFLIVTRFYVLNTLGSRSHCCKVASADLKVFRKRLKYEFRKLGWTTLPCLYILEVVLYSRRKCELIRGRDVHKYVMEAGRTLESNSTDRQL
ncbi:hypothetical protein J6590_055018 [Homalodisca vitripennis]|nr:hypothetical protein J6590_055018 [Homalodisca vitripennis]